MRIDAHQHFWQLARGDYDWLVPELAVLYSDYLPNDLTEHLSQCNIDGTVLVQAAATVAETEYMLHLADQNDYIKAVVGWVDFESELAVETIERFAQHPLFKGVRPMIQAIDDLHWMLNPDFDAVFDTLIDLDLTFDALVKPQHLNNLLVLKHRYPQLKMVIDHAAKPDIAGGNYDEWSYAMIRLASETNCLCKLSGLWTEAGGDIGIDVIQRYSELLIKHFGASRLMWGSDWPVLRLVGEYRPWFQQSKQLIEDLTQSQQRQIMGGTAQRFYAIKR